MISLTTSPNFRFVSSRVFCTRFTSLAFSSVSRTRYRVKSRNSALWARGNEAGFEQAMSQQVGDPLGVFDVRLPSRHGFDMLRIDDQQFKTAFRASLKTGFQYTPVASKATWVHPCSLSQSPSCNNSSVVVK